MENDCTVEKSLLLVNGMGSRQCPEVEAQGQVPQQRCRVGHADGWVRSHLRREDVIRQLLDKKKESTGPVFDQKPRDMPHRVLGILIPGVGLTLEIQGITQRL